MKRFASLSVLMPVCAFAGDGILGTKTGGGAITQTTSSPIGAMPMIQMIVALGVVFGLVKWLLPKLLSKVNQRLVTGLGSSIKIEESATFAGGSLYVVQARDKTLLLSVSSNGVSCLSDLSSPKELVTDEPQTFLEILEQSPGTVPGAVVEVVESDPEEEQIKAALNRLARLAG